MGASKRSRLLDTCQVLWVTEKKNEAPQDVEHWQIPLSRRFRSLKLWFVIRTFGIEGLQRHIRKGISLAMKFEQMVLEDQRFEIPVKRILGMVVFRLWGDNQLTETLLKRLNKSGKLHMVPASLKGKYVIRFTITSQYTTESDIERDWRVITDTATKVLRDSESEEDEAFSDEEVSSPEEPEHLTRVPSLKKREYGMSLLLSNVPQSPKLINGSFAALFDNNDVMVEYAKQITNSDFNGRPIRLSPRRRVKLRDQTKQQSLDSSISQGKKFQGKFKQGSLDSKVEEILERHSQGDGKQLMEIEDLIENEAEEIADVVQFKLRKEVPEIHAPKDSGRSGVVCPHCGHFCGN